MENHQQSTSKSVIFLLVIITVLFLLLNASHVSAEKKDEAKVLVIYTSMYGEIDEYQRSLDMLLSHFTNDVTFISSDEVEKKDLQNITHLFYFGQVNDQLPVHFVSLFDDFDGTFVAIGYNSDMLGDQFHFVTPLHEKEINEVYLTSKKDEALNVISQKIIEMKVTEDSEIVLEGKNVKESTTYPILVKNKNRYYYAVDSIDSQKSILFGEILHDIFNVNHEEKHLAYIRLEDIHPLVNPENMKQIANILKEKKIPYMVAVIPVYTNPETGEKHYFSDSPKLLKVLKKMQKDGASIVLHGYTHQFRNSETGEGFEFWDVENNTPIYSKPDESFTLKAEVDFKSKSEYETYIQNLKQFEREYIERKLTRGIQELVNYGLYPLAFEAPHYTMSQNGYNVVSEFFSTYVGQIQLSDKSWEIMDTTLYTTSPSFLNGMQLLPETLGYVKPDDPNAVQNMMKKVEALHLTKDGMLAAFYHPYLGVERFIELITEMEKIPNIKWIDLKQMDLWVKADNVEIHTENGEVKVNINYGKLLRTSLDFPLFHLKKFIEIVIWAMAFIGGIAVIAFIVFTIILQSRKTILEG